MSEVFQTEGPFKLFYCTQYNKLKKHGFFQGGAFNISLWSQLFSFVCVFVQC